MPTDNREIIIRPATLEDLPAINDIYNHFVIHSTCTYQTAPATMPERIEWFNTHDSLHPVTVATIENEIVGWGSISRFHARAAYAKTVENSVYVRHDLHRRGAGMAILLDSIVRAKSLGHHAIIAGIDADQIASVALHQKAGFTTVGHLREVGHKFDRWLDVIYMELLL